MIVKSRDKEIKFKTVSREQLQKIINDIKAGSPKKLAALSNGLGESHLYELIEQGNLDILEGKLDTICAWLAESLAKVDKENINEAIEEIKTSSKGHAGKQWYLEMVFWRHFGKSAENKQLAEEMEELKRLIKGANINVGAESSKENQGSEE